MHQERPRAARILLWTAGVLCLGTVAGYGLSGGYDVGPRVSAAGRAEVLESPFAAVAERVLPGVVSVEARRWVRHPALSEEPPGESFPEGDSEIQRGPDVTIPVPSSGSGFVVSEDGTVLTNAHVVQGASSIWIHLADGRELVAEVIGTDPETDVAVLRARDERPFSVVPLGDSDSLRIGDWVAAIGNPLGQFAGSLTVGVVSAKGRTEVSIRGGTPTYQDFIQTDASINFGNSGGPLVNQRGQAVGMNTAFSGPGNGIGFAIPINFAREIADALLTTGHVERAYLGVILQDLDPDLALGLGLDRRRGALLREVQTETPAARAGLKPGDVLLEFEGWEVSDVAHLRLSVARAEVGSRVRLKVWRYGRELEADVVMARRPDSGSEASPAPPREEPSELLIGVRPAEEAGTLGAEGLVIDTVTPDGLGAELGLKVGDYILEIDGDVPASSAALEAALDRSRHGRRPVVLRLARGERRWFQAVPFREAAGP